MLNKCVPLSRAGWGSVLHAVWSQQSGSLCTRAQAWHVLGGNVHRCTFRQPNWWVNEWLYLSPPPQPRKNKHTGWRLTLLWQVIRGCETFRNYFIRQMLLIKPHATNVPRELFLVLGFCYCWNSNSLEPRGSLGTMYGQDVGMMSSLQDLNLCSAPFHLHSLRQVILCCEATVSVSVRENNVCCLFQSVSSRPYHQESWRSTEK
jgi:hypothetical protein